MHDCEESVRTAREGQIGQPADAQDVATRLHRMGIPAEERHVFTCAMPTARFWARQKPGGTAYVIGEGGLLHGLHENGYAIVDHNPDYVVVTSAARPT